MVGSSARAAVFSLARAGFRAWAVDQFGDRDLRRVAACAVCPPGGYPDAIPLLARQFPPGPVLYTGGLENHPHVIAALAAGRELWGTLPDALARVRDPFALFPLLAQSGIAVPRLAPRDAPCPSEGRWLRKPFRSAGGLGVRFAAPGEPPSPDHYFQEFVDGVPMSAVYAGTTLLGVTEQLIGEPRLHATGFAYCGNVGPLDVAAPVLPLTLRGTWGVDFVLRGGPVVLEVNPRYTAAVEVLELATGRPTPPAPLPEGRGERGHSGTAQVSDIACDVLSPPFREGGRGGGSLCVGKAIYYAPHDLTFPDGGPWDSDLAGDFDPWRVPGFADIPDPGSAIRRGWPVLTVFADGPSPAAVRERLQSRAAELERLFGGHTS